MKVINVSESTIFLDDINIAVIYSRNNTPFEINDRLAKKSKSLKFALKEGMMVDVTEGIPEVLPKPRGEFEISKASNPKKGLFVTDKPKLSPDSISRAKNSLTTKGSADDDFAADGSMSIVWTGPTCLKKDAQILTPHGSKSISSLKIGDYVFTAQGRIRKVVRLYKRKYSGEMIVLRTQNDTEEICVTPNHEIFVIRGEPCILRKSQACKPTCMTQFNKKHTPYGVYDACTRRPYENYKLERVAARDLTLYDFQYLPKLQDDKIIGKIDITNFLGSYERYSTDGESIWFTKEKNHTAKSTVARSIGVPVDWVYQVDKLGAYNQGKIQRALAKAESSVPKYDPAINVSRIPVCYSLDEEFAEILGLYVAEGSSTASTCSFAFHKNEKNLIDKTRRLIKSVFGLKSSLKPEKNKEGTSVLCHNSILAKFLQTNCDKNACHKKIPSFIFSATDTAKTAFINGLWSGDGCRFPRKKDNSIKYGTSSASLAYGLRFLLSSFGVSAGVSVEQESEKTFHNKTYVYDEPKVSYVVKISGKQLYENEWLKNFKYNSVPKMLNSSPRQRQYFCDERGAFYKFTSITKEMFDGYVYNIEVEDDHSYLVNGKAFKNCDAGGYAAMNRKFMFGLDKKGVNVAYDHLVSMNDMDESVMSKINALKQVRVPDDAPKIYGMTAPLIYDWSRYKMLFTMMETRRLHPDYVKRCNSADEIVVPSEWCKHIFEVSGVRPPVHVVPLGVDTDIYYPDAEPLNFSCGLKDYVFLSVFGWSMRKGYDVLLKAYLEEFTSDEPVSLLISSRYFGSTDESKKKVIRDDVARVSSMVRNPKKPHLVLFGDVLSVDMMPRLYASADCYVLPSRGEGFGLPFCEAGACKKPVIATNYSGQTDFLTPDNSYLVGIDGFRCADDSLAWISYFYQNAEFPILGPGVVEEFRYWMRYAYENRDDAQEKAGRLYDKVVKDYSWDVCVDKMHAKLKSTFEKLPEWREMNNV